MGGSAPRRDSRPPVETTGFVDRRAELAEGRELPARARPVTLTGPGGAGRTRLAGCLAREFPDGVHVVHLSGPHDPALVPVAAADALGPHDHAAQPPPDAGSSVRPHRRPDPAPPTDPTPPTDRNSMPVPPAREQDVFDHRMAVFSSDEEFVAASLPFLAEGLAAPDEPPPVAIAAPGKLDLLRDALGEDARHVGFVPHTEWYRGSAANAVAQGAGYLAANAGPRGSVHLLMEPDWGGRAGRSVRESAEWIRYEAFANLLFAPLATTVLCAYDARTAGRAVIAAARRAHPGTDVYEDPLRIAAELDAVPLPPVPYDAHPLPAPEPHTVRTWAAGRGLPAADAELFAAAVSEAADPLDPVSEVLLWGEAPGCVCELRSPRRVDDPLAGFVPPPSAEPAPGQGLWFARQVCAYVDVRDDDAGAVVRLQYA